MWVKKAIHLKQNIVSSMHVILLCLYGPASKKDNYMLNSFVILMNKNT